VRVNLVPVVPSVMRKAAVALAVAASCLFSVRPAEASPIRKGHARSHKAGHHAVTTAQAFARLANRKPERRVTRHPQAWFQRTQGAPGAEDHDAAIQTNVAPASQAELQAAPRLRLLELLVPVQAPFHSHDGFAPSSPRAPPVLG
jgi:hypothetical protein